MAAVASFCAVTPSILSAKKASRTWCTVEREPNTCPLCVEPLWVELVEVVLGPADDEVAAEAPVMPTPRSAPAVSTVAAPTARRFFAGVLNLV